MHMGARKVRGRCAKGVRRCANVHGKVHKGAQRCADVHERCAKGVQRCANVHKKVHKGAQRCASVCGSARKGAQVGPEPRQSGRVVRVWWVQAQCREIEKKHRNFSKTCLFDRAYCKKLTWSQLGKGSGSGTRPGDGWGVCQLSLEGSGSPGGGGEPEQVRVRACEKSKIRWSLNENYKRVTSKIDDW